MANPELLRPRCDSQQCVRCRKRLSPGDRVQLVMIVEKLGRNPATKELGAFLSPEFEMAHIDCNDTSLNGRVIVT
jgi:hypothetical protein